MVVNTSVARGGCYEVIENERKERFMDVFTQGLLAALYKRLNSMRAVVKRLPLLVLVAGLLPWGLQASEDYRASQVSRSASSAVNGSRELDDFGYGSEIEVLNLHTGQLYLQTIDAVIEGTGELDITLARSYQKHALIGPNESHNLANWTLEVPEIYIPLLPTMMRYKRSSRTNRPAFPLVGCGQMIRNYLSTTAYNLEYIWGGVFLRIPGQPDRSLLFKTNSSGAAVPNQFVTADNWKATCYGSSNKITRFEVTSPRGVKYRMNYFQPALDGALVYPEPIWGRVIIYYDLNNQPVYGSGIVGYRNGVEGAKASSVSFKATFVEDLLGNSLTYNYSKYDPNGTFDTLVSQLDSIIGSDGRTVSFSYLGKTSVWYDKKHGGKNLIRRLNYMTVDDKSWWFKYETNKGELSEVVRPDLRSWKYDYSGAPGNLGNGHDKWHHAQPGISSVTYPDGGKITYDFTTRNKKSYFPSLKEKFNYLSLKKKTIFANGINKSGSFNFDYRLKGGAGNSTDGDQTIVTDNVMKLEYRFHSARSAAATRKYLAGRLKEELVYDNGAGLLNKSTSYTYKKSARLGKAHIPFMGSRFDFRVSSAQVSETMHPIGGLEPSGSKWTTTYSDFDAFGNPRIMTELSGDIFDNYTTYRRIDYTYLNNTSNWLIGLPLTEKNAEGMAINNTYYANGLLKSASKYGRKTSYTYTNEGNIKTETDPNGHRVNYSDYFRGIARKKIQRVQDVNGTVFNYITSTVVNNDGTIRSTTDPEGNVKKYEYNKLGELLIIDYPLGNDYVNSDKNSDKFGLFYVSFFGGKRDFSKIEWINGFGAVTRTARAYPRTEKSKISYILYTFDKYGRTTFESYPNEEVEMLPRSTLGIKKTYDALGRLRSEWDNVIPNRRYIRYSGNYVYETDSMDNRTTYKYGQQGTDFKLLSITTPEQKHQEMKYNDAGLITEITNGSTTREYIYDSRMLLKEEVHPEFGKITYVRDDNDNVLSKKVAGGQTISYKYDARNRLIMKWVNGKSLETTYEYDKNDKITLVKNANSRTLFSYDANGQLVREVLEVDGKRFEMGYEYDMSQNLKAITYPSGEVIDYAPNGWGEPSRVGRFSDSVSWHPNGALKSYINANGTELNVALNGKDEVKGITHSDFHSEFSSQRYEYYRGGNMKIIYGQDTVRRMFYDKDNQLTRSVFTDRVTYQHYQENFSYDKLGNIVSSNTEISGGESNFPTSNFNYSYNARSNLLSGVNGMPNGRYKRIQYDALGNIINDGLFRYSFDAYSRLRNVISPQNISYSYDGNDRLVHKSSSGQDDVYYLYSSEGKKLLEYRPGGKALDDDSLQEFYYLNNHLVAKKKLTQMHLDDTDRDGMSDAYEIANGLNLNVAYVRGDDADGDGLTDLEESQLGTNANSTDTDLDGLDDGYELSIGTNPSSADTDGDGVDDFEELALGRNPNFNEALLVPILSLLLD